MLCYVSVEGLFDLVLLEDSSEVFIFLFFSLSASSGSMRHTLDDLTKVHLGLRLSLDVC